MKKGTRPDRVPLVSVPTWKRHLDTSGKGISEIESGAQARPTPDERAVD